ncbi:MAG: aminomethyl-transferring glycine dehydrogenase [Phycisphaeraceae bacterium]|nr:MAG: aminomethyl-transferring glycine dehydrogenase [Phycisphaeraceae bacterium]
MTTLNPELRPERTTPVTTEPTRSRHTPGDRRAVGPSPLDWHDGFVHRHVGPDEGDIAEMLKLLGYASLDAFVDEVVPPSIRLREPLKLTEPAGRTPRGEHELLGVLRSIAGKNEIWRSCIGMGYHGTITPPVILRNILENPGWYTQYTPYQPEISQGRLEILLNFQTMISELTALSIANASLLDEGTAAGEAMAMAVNIAPRMPHAFFAADHCHAQTLGVLRTRCASLGVELEVGDPFDAGFDPSKYAGVLVQYPDTSGEIHDFRDLITRVKAAGGIAVMAADPLALTLLTPPGELGADIAIGSAQRFGVPMGFGGPHAAYLATSEAHVRKMPGRLVGVSKDSQGNPALRLAIQTREQHIRRDRATSNICTAQVLLAIMAACYGMYHGPTGLTRIARRVRTWTGVLAEGLRRLGHAIVNEQHFDTLRVRLSGAKGGAGNAARVRELAEARRINFRYFDDGTVGVALDETADREFIREICTCFGCGNEVTLDEQELLDAIEPSLPASLARTSPFMAQHAFKQIQTETEMLRHLRSLQDKDLSLAHSMIPLGSCTMKLNGTSEMIPVTWPEFGNIHPFAPASQTSGYRELFAQLESWLGEITGFPAVSLQPNAGSQGEYAGLITIRAYHESRGEGRRNVCLVPESAHGTNPASAVLAGMKVVAVKNRPDGAIDLDDLKKKVEANADSLAAIMVTYPSTCGVFESHIREVCSLVHEHGGQVYLDGANMNAQVGLCRPGDYGADVCHLNLHKTFCIPHGGGGPGMGPIACAEHLAPFLPGHALDEGERQVSAAAYGSPSILPISWMYIALMGADGLAHATKIAILNANYMAKRLEGHYDVLFGGENGRCAHEFVIDCRTFKKSAGVEIDDIAKRLMDFGFHAPTMSWPVPGTLMVEPTESEPRETLDAFCDALIQIAGEAGKIESGEWPRDDNPLKNAPHTIAMVCADEWTHPYPRSVGGFPNERTRRGKFWPSVARVDNPYGDRNLVCTCAGVEELTEH